MGLLRFVWNRLGATTPPAEPFGRSTPSPAPEGEEALAAGRARELAANSRDQPQTLERISVSDAVKGPLRRASPCRQQATKTQWPLVVP
jgi:hypothetical protein